MKTGFTPAHHLIAMTMALGICPTVVSASPGTVLSTGIGPHQSLIPIGQQDDEWRLVSAPSGVPLGPVTVVNPARAHFADFGSTAQWISPSAQTNVDAPFGLYTYEISFGLGVRRLDDRPIVGHTASDNRLIDIRVNGEVGFAGPTAGLPCPSALCQGEEFRQPLPFSLPATLFVNGLNTLQVTIENLGPSRSNPTAFAFAAVIPASPIPEPSGALLMVMGVAGLGIVRTRKSSC